MIKVKKDYDKVPKILRSKEAEQELRKVLLKQHDYKSSRVYYQHPEVRESLKEIYRNKCAYCESVFKSDTDIVITHYRPVPKYYWLVHEWSNLLPVCRECQYEEDADFLVQGLQVIEPPKDVLDWRANSPMMLGEKAVLLNPELDEPKEHLELQTNGRIDGDTNRGGETVECYNLNRPSLLDARKKIIADAQDAINNQLFNVEDYLINTVSHEKSISDVLNLDPLVDSKMLALAFNPTFSRIVDMAGPEREFSFAARFLMKDFWRFVVRFQKTNLRKQILTRAFENFNKGPSTTSPNGAALGILDKEEPLPPEMKEAVLSLSIDQLTVKNFRGFTEKEFTFKKGFNLLLGDNGTGKTAMLDAVCVNLNGLLGCFDSPDEVNIIKPGDVHMTSHIYDGNIRLEPVYPAAIKTECAVMTKKISWEAARQNKKSYSNPLNPELKAIARQFRQAVQQGFHVTLPLIAYYGTGRLWLQKKSGPVEPLKPVSRFFGYQDCLDPQSNEKELARWMKLEELSQKQNRSNGRLYSAVKKTIVDSVTDFEEVWFDFAEDSIMLKLTNGQTLPVAHFSDGYRNMIAMIADIAFRMAILNPHLGPDVAQKTPGVVLIDEIDLHLHPKWQRSVVDDLKRTFPLVQFIATSHSPFIVQALRDSSEIINLDTENKFAGKLDLSIEDITEDIMGVHMPQQSKRYQEMTKVAEKYYKLLDEGKSSENDNQLKEIKHRLDELLIPYSDDPAFTTYLKMKRTAADLNETGK